MNAKPKTTPLISVKGRTLYLAIHNAKLESKTLSEYLQSLIDKDLEE
jgi:hypothetical protein